MPSPRHKVGAEGDAVSECRGLVRENVDCEVDHSHSRLEMRDPNGDERYDGPASAQSNFLICCSFLVFSFLRFSHFLKKHLIFLPAPFPRLSGCFMCW